MQRTLFGKMLFVVLAFCLIMTGICVYLMRTMHGNYHDEVDQMVNRNIARLFVEANLFFDAAPIDADNLLEAMTGIASLNSGLDAYLLDDV